MFNSSPDDTSTIVYLVLSFTFGGGLVSMFKAIGDNRTAKAASEAIAAKSGPEITDLSVGALSKVINELQKNNVQVCEERDQYRERLLEMEKVVSRLRSELERVQGELHTLLRAHAEPVASLISEHVEDSLKR